MAGKVFRIGVEMEGGWDNPPDGVNIHPDGSVRVTANYVGEISSPPKRFDELLQFIQNYYPNVVDVSCGLHFHVSVCKPNDYAHLATKKFFEHFYNQAQLWARREELPEDHPFWSRWYGNNRYAVRRFLPTEQIHCTDKGAHRQTGLNYCWTLHGTMEVRLFPMFEEMEHTLSAARLVHDCVENYLSSQSTSNRAMTRTVRTKEVKEDGIELGIIPPENAEEDEF